LRDRIITAEEEAFHATACTPAEIRHFFMTKAHHSGSKASIYYPWQPLKHTLS